jgi:parallel beta-helix repeat protein
MFNAPAVTLNSLENSTVSGNILTGVRDGILMTGNFLNSTVMNNSVQATGTAYQFSNSLGGNRISGNAVVGTPLTPWVLSATHATDSMQSLKDE